MTQHVAADPASVKQLRKRCGQLKIAGAADFLLEVVSDPGQLFRSTSGVVIETDLGPVVDPARWELILLRMHRLPLHAAQIGWATDPEAVPAIRAAILAAAGHLLVGDGTQAADALAGAPGRHLAKAWRCTDLSRMTDGEFDLAAMSRADLRAVADRQAKSFRDFVRRLNAHTGYNRRGEEVLKGSKAVRLDPERLRLLSPDARFRRLVRAQRELQGWLGSLLEVVGEHKGATATKWASRADRGARKLADEAGLAWQRGQMLRSVQDGREIHMEDVVAEGLRSRLAEFYALSLGLQSVADAKGYEFAMLTLTLSGEWHQARTGRKSGRKSEWNGSTPKEAAGELQRLWKSVRTMVVNLAPSALGLAVREPHEDGTPHLHALVLAPRDELVAVRDFVVRWNAKQQGDGTDLESCDGGVFETTAKGRQLEFRVWEDRPVVNGKRGSSPASYITKYLRKTLGADGDEGVGVRAWKRGAQVRQTSWFGLGKGFLAKWRAVYRSTKGDGLDDPELAAIEACDLQAARVAMTERDWGLALAIVGGVDLPCEWQPVREERTNSYGEVVQRVVGFAMPAGGFLPARGGDWMLVSKSVVAAEDIRQGEGRAAAMLRRMREGAAAPGGDVEPG